MNETRTNIHDLIEQTQDAMLGLGLTRQSVWGCYCSKYLRIARFFKERDCVHYDDAILAEYMQIFKGRLDNKEISEYHFRVVRKAAAYL